MAAVDDLIRARDAAAAELAAIRERTAINNLAGGEMGGAGVNPNAKGPLAVDHGEYYDRLLKTVADLNKQIAALQGPTVTRHVGILG